MAVQTQRQAPSTSWWFNSQRKLAPYVFIAPFFLLFAAFFIFPVVYSLLLSFQEQTGLSTPKWVGLKNYAELMQDSRFIQSLLNTTYFALGSLLIQLPLAFALALAFNSVYAQQLTQLYRVSFFFPVLTSSVVVSLIFVLVLDTEYGMLNAGLQQIGLDKVPWLTSTRWAMPAVILLGVWRWSGINAFYFLAGLKNIPNSLIEAAMIDGANSWQILLRIIIPLLRPVMMFVVIQSIIGSYSLFAEPFLLTGGGPADATLTMSMYLYITGFRYFRLGYASSVAYTLVLIILALSVINLYFFRAFRED
ncbi:MAG TPA: sugar ABC transporter permease [Caldilineaceae bacterium]|nr:sugar ABC transporter permease [Caldilineaceae bacterium]